MGRSHYKKKYSKKYKKSFKKHYRKKYKKGIFKYKNKKRYSPIKKVKIRYIQIHHKHDKHVVHDFKILVSEKKWRWIRKAANIMVKFKHPDKHVKHHHHMEMHKHAHHLTIKQLVSAEAQELFFDGAYERMYAHRNDDIIKVCRKAESHASRSAEHKTHEAAESGDAKRAKHNAEHMAENAAMDMLGL